mgnify:CR=1 FL=1
MPDVFAVHDAAKVRVFGRPEVLDGLRQPSATLVGRIAPDEVIYVGEPGEAGRIVEDVEGQLGDRLARCLVVDHTDGWSFHSVVGPDVGDLFRMMAQWKLPETSGETIFTVGSVCHCAGKVFVRPGRIDVLTGTEVRAWVDHDLEHLGHFIGAHRVAAPTSDPIGVRSEGVSVQ